MSRLGDTGLNVEQDGRGDPVVLIHGVTLDLRMWSPQVPELSKRFRVIRYDLRGFGRSERPIRQDHRHRDDLKLLLDELQISKAHLIGLSRGGRIALEFAIDHPDRVLKLVLIDPAIRYKGKDKPFPQDEYRERAIECMKKAADTWLEADIWKSPGLDHTRPEIEEIVREFFSWQQLLPKSDLDYSRIPKLEVPTLVLVGDGESEEMRGSAKKLSDMLPNGQYQPVPNAGHIANMDRPDLVNEALLKFLNG